MSKGGPKIKSLEERFWKKVEKTDYCWNWTGYKQKSGHGRIGIGGVGGKYKGNFGSHRASWIIHFGIIPKDMCVCHKCDNPSCVRPDHLFLGTQVDNLFDMTEKGRRRGNDGKGKNNSNYGKHWNENFKEKMREYYSHEYEIVSPTGDVIKFKNLRKFCRDNDLNNGHANMLLNGKCKSCKGYTNLKRI